MAIVVFEHDPDETSARFGQVLRDHGHRLRVLRLFDGDPIPPDFDDVDGLVVMGGPMNVDQTDSYPWLDNEVGFIRRAHEIKLPVVGVCLGAQLLAKALGGEVDPMDAAQIGWHPVQLTFAGTNDPVHAGIPWKTVEAHWHGWEVTKPPPGATVLAESAACKVQAFNIGFTTYGFQHHFEWDRADLERLLERPDCRDWIAGQGADPDAFAQQIDTHFSLYRHLGDRLGTTMADLLFPIDKRLDHKSGPLTSFEPARV